MRWVAMRCYEERWAAFYYALFGLVVRAGVASMIPLDAVCA